MRDPNRIPDVLARLQAAWETYPELRLGQLLLCAVDKDDLFNIEDDHLIQRVEAFANRAKP